MRGRRDKPKSHGKTTVSDLACVVGAMATGDHLDSPELEAALDRIQAHRNAQKTAHAEGSASEEEGE